MKTFRSCRLPQQITLFRFDQKKLRRLRPAAKVCSTLLPKLSATIFLLGALTAFLRKTPITGESPLALFLSGLFVLTFLHEAAHIIVSIACGCPVDEAGLLLCGPIPIGAYIEADPPKRPRLHIRVALAGLESDLLAVGILLFLQSFTGSRLCTELAFFNFLSVLSNAAPISGRDGEHALSARLGIGDVAFVAKAILSSPQQRRRIRRRGFNGWLTLCFFRIVRCAKVLVFLTELLVFLFFQTCC